MARAKDRRFLSTLPGWGAGKRDDDNRVSRPSGAAVVKNSCPGRRMDIGASVGAGYDKKRLAACAVRIMFVVVWSLTHPASMPISCDKTCCST